MKKKQKKRKKVLLNKRLNVSELSKVKGGSYPAGSNCLDLAGCPTPPDPDDGK